MKINLKLTFILTSALFQRLFDLETAIKLRQLHKRFIKLITYTITLLFWQDVFLDLNLLYISKVLAFLDYILSLAKAWDKIKSKKVCTFSIKRKFLSKNFIILRANNNSVINS